MADEGCGNTREGEEVLSLALISPVQATAAGKPGHRAFHDPSMAAQALGGLDAAAGDPRHDAAPGQPLPQMVAVVALVAVQFGGATSTWSTARADRWDAAHQGFQGWPPCRLAPEIASEMGRPVRSQIRWISDPFLPRSVGFGPVRCPL